jgi:hypothetical protein
MRNNNPCKTKKYFRRNGRPGSRDPEHQNFDTLDNFNEFTNLRIINRYRKLGEDIMNRNFWE